MNVHERIEELIVLRSLGGLEQDEVRRLREELDEHGTDCEECRRLQTEYAEVAGRLAFALDPHPVPDGLEDRVVAAATASRVRLAPVGSEGALPARTRVGPSKLNLRPLVAVAAAVVVFIAGVGVGAVALGRDEGVPEGARVVTFEGEGPGPTLAVAYEPGEPGVYLLGSRLEAPPAGKSYEVWMIDGDRPIPGPCFRPSDDGSVFAFVDAELGSTDTMAVTVEPESCSSAPTSPPILTARIA